MKQSFKETKMQKEITFPVTFKYDPPYQIVIMSINDTSTLLTKGLHFSS